ncbi:MAG: hypothetical protein P1U56_05795 [Saprospiraceae bacterium]|nr:hypothetical protein [Saprospiraceae bacterium]
MNAYKHAQLSVSKRGGSIDDYYPIHSFMDATKEMCSDHRHRIFHNLWGIRRIIIPIFGHSMTNSDHKVINVKDVCEQDHVLPDYHHKFIPTLSDFVDQMEEITDDEKIKINTIHTEYNFTPKETELVLSPLGLTGEMKSLLLTHNSWFLHVVLPKIFNRPIALKDYSISPSAVFEKMNYSDWMNNGVTGLPASCKQINEFI